MKKISFIALFILFAIFVVISLTNGKFDISASEYFKIFLDIFSARESPASIVVLDIRLPRIVAAVIIGVALSTAGGAYQNMFINPLVSPSILGVLSGASFGAALAIVMGFGIFTQMALTFAFGFAAVIIAGVVAFFGGNKNMIMLVLGGVISSSLFSSLLAVLKYTADPNETLPAITYFLMGSLSFATKDVVYIVCIPMILGSFLLVMLGNKIDALSMGEEEARSLGVDTRMLKIQVIFLATLISALSVMLAGIIGWIGLIVPHIARFIYGANSRVMLFSSAFIGALFLLICDLISRELFTYEVPIGIVTSFFGIPIFIVVLLKKRLN